MYYRDYKEREEYEERSFLENIFEKYEDFKDSIIEYCSFLEQNDLLNDVTLNNTLYCVHEFRECIEPYILNLRIN